MDSLKKLLLPLLLTCLVTWVAAQEADWSADAYQGPDDDVNPLGLDEYRYNNRWKRQAGPALVGSRPLPQHLPGLLKGLVGKLAPTIGRAIGNGIRAIGRGARRRISSRLGQLGGGRGLGRWFGRGGGSGGGGGGRGSGLRRRLGGLARKGLGFLRKFG